MKISKNTVARINYTLRDDSGAVIDSSEGCGPFEYLHGNGNLIPGLEAALEGREPGDKFALSIAPKDGYGERDEALIVEIPRARFEDGGKIEAGMKFIAGTPAGPMQVTVVKADGDKITIDGNHALAGKNLNFEIEVVDARGATEAELFSPRAEEGCEGGCGGCASREEGCRAEGRCGDGCHGNCGGCE